MNLDAFKSATCSKQACWMHGGFSDGGVEVSLGTGWHAFMLEDHFANAHRCVSQRRGELCDAIAMHEQQERCRFRLIEAKRGGKVSSKAARQLQRGADYLESIVGMCPRRIQVIAELHTGNGPAVSVRPAQFVVFKERGARIPVVIV